MMIHKLLSLWVLIPLLGSVVQVAAADSVHQIAQVSQEAQNAQTFNSILQLGIGIILATILARMQRAQTQVNKQVAQVTVDSVSQASHDELQKQVDQLKSALALTEIQKRQVEIAQEQADTSKAIVALLGESKGRESAILDTQTRMSNNITSVGSQIDNLTDITIASADVNNTNLETLLTWLAQSEAKLIAAIKKRETSGDSKPIPVVSPDEIDKLKVQEN